MTPLNYNCTKGKCALSYKGSYWLSWSHQFESFTVATMTWLTVMEYLYHKLTIFFPLVVNTDRSIPHSWLITRFVTRLTRQVCTAYPSGATEFTPDFWWDSCYLIFSLMCMFCRSLFVLLSFFFWPLWCLSLFDLRILINPLVSSNSSYIVLTIYFWYWNRAKLIKR